MYVILAAQAMFQKFKEMAQRLTPNPSISVADLQVCLADFMTKEKSRDLHKILRTPLVLTWKTVPDPSWILKIKELLSSLSEVTKNGVVPGQKLRIALEKEHDKAEINMTSKTFAAFSDNVSTIIRIAMAQIRMVMTDPQVRERTFKKAGKEERDAMQSVMDKLTDLLVTIPPIPESWTASKDETADSMLSDELVAASDPQVAAPPAAPESSALDDKLSIFSRVLQRQDSATSSAASSPILAVRWTEEAITVRLEGPSMHDNFRSQFSQGDVELIDAAETQRPIARDGKSQLQRIRVGQPKKRKGRKPKAKTAKTAEEEEEVEEEEEEVEEPKKRPSRKRPSTAKSKAKPSTAKSKAKPLTKQDNSEVATASAEEANSQDYSEVEANPKPADAPEEGDKEEVPLERAMMSKAGSQTMRKAKNSKQSGAYHSAKKAALLEGLTAAKATKAAKTAYKKAGLEFDEALRDVD